MDEPWRDPAASNSPGDPLYFSILTLSLASAFVVSASQGGASMNRADESRPEPILFLLEAADAMEQYKQAHGEYAKEWHQIDISFANGPYNEGDQGTRPTKNDKIAWRPKGCKYTYWIVSIEKDKFLIQARTHDNRAEYEIASGMAAPRKLLNSLGNELCTVEQPKGKHIPGAAMFLNAAFLAFQKYHQGKNEFPNSWESVHLHWALTKHRPDDPTAYPPPGTGRVWKPAGSRYTYTIVTANKNQFEIQSSNTEGLEDYGISSTQTYPAILNKK